MDTTTNLGLGLVVTFAVACGMAVVAILGVVLNRIASQFERDGDR